MAKDQFNDPKKPNLKVLRSIRVKGEHVQEGSIIAKSAFPNKGSWQNLAHMEPPRVEETDEKVEAEKQAPKPAKTAKTAKTTKPAPNPKPPGV